MVFDIGSADSRLVIGISPKNLIGGSLIISGALEMEIHRLSDDPRKAVNEARKWG